MSNSLPILVLPKDTAAAVARGARKAGYFVILTDRPESVKVILPGSEIISNDMLMAAMHGLCNAGFSTAKEKFTEELHKRMKAREDGSK